MTGRGDRWGCEVCLQKGVLWEAPALGRRFQNPLCPPTGQEQSRQRCCGVAQAAGGRAAPYSPHPGPGSELLALGKAEVTPGGT